MDQIFKTKKPPQTRPYRGLIIVLIVLVILLLAVLIYLAVTHKSKSSDVDLLTVTVTVTVTAKTSATAGAKVITPTVTVTSTQDGQGIDEEAINGSKIVAQYFMNAREKRSITQAKPYVTSNFLANNTQEGFAGTSSPSLDGFEIQDVKIVESGKKYQVSVKVNWMLNGQPSGSDTWAVNVVRENGEFLVDSYTMGQ